MCWTNVLLISISRRSPYRQVFDAIVQGQLILIISNEIITEYEEIIAKKATAEIAGNILEMMIELPNVVKTEIFYRWNLIPSDFDDNKFSDAAIASGADYLVSNDAHFDVLKNIDFPAINIINIDGFLKLLQK